MNFKWIWLIAIIASLGALSGAADAMDVST
jgi:hypothetical protein